MATKFKVKEVPFQTPSLIFIPTNLQKNLKIWRNLCEEPSCVSSALFTSCVGSFSYYIFLCAWKIEVDKRKQQLFFSKSVQGLSSLSLSLETKFCISLLQNDALLWPTLSMRSRWHIHENK